MLLCPKLSLTTVKGISMSTACVPCVCLSQWVLALASFSDASVSDSDRNAATSAKNAFNTLWIANGFKGETDCPRILGINDKVFGTVRQASPVSMEYVSSIFWSKVAGTGTSRYLLPFPMTFNQYWVLPLRSILTISPMTIFASSCNRSPVA